MKGLLLAGGSGTRLRPLTFTGNKHMLPIANRPMISYGLAHLLDAGITEIGVVLGPLNEGVREWMGDGTRFGATVTYIEQTNPLGIAHAILLSEDFLGDEPFVVHLGDNLLKEGIRPLVSTYEKSRSPTVLALARVRKPHQFGVAEVDTDRIIRVVEKPKQPRTDLAIIGVYIFEPRILQFIKKLKPSGRNEYEITEAIQMMIDAGERIPYLLMNGWWKDTGKPDDLLEANQLVLQSLEHDVRGVVGEDSIVVGNMVLGENSRIISSTIRGPVIIGKDSTIGPGAYVGPYTSIGDNVVVSRSSIENSIIMGGVRIESITQTILDAIIGTNCSIVAAARLPSGYRFVLGESSNVSL